jgi:hypothetical protein
MCVEGEGWRPVRWWTRWRSARKVGMRRPHGVLCSAIRLEGAESACSRINSYNLFIWKFGSGLLPRRRCASWTEAQ